MLLPSWPDCSDLSYFLAFLVLPRLLAPGKKTKPSSWKNQIRKRENISFLKKYVWRLHTHPSEDGSIPSLFKRTLHHLGFTNSGSSIFNSFNEERPCAPRTEQTNWLQRDDIAEAAFLCYLAIFLCEIILQRHIFGW